MAVTFDSTFEQGFTAPGSGGPASFTSNAGNVSGSVGNNSDRILIGGVAFSNTIANLGTVTMTWNGVSMTLIQQTNHPTQLGSAHIFGLLNPDVGANVLLVDWTLNVNPATYLGAVSVYNASNWQNGGTDTGTGTAPTSVITTAANNMVFAIHDNFNASSTAINQGTSAWIDTRFSTNGAMAYKASASGSETISWTLGSSVDWCIAKVDVIATTSSVTAIAGGGLRMQSVIHFQG